jgi:hypothetical protein
MKMKYQTKVRMLTGLSILLVLIVCVMGTLWYISSSRSHKTTEKIIVVQASQPPAAQPQQTSSSNSRLPTYPESRPAYPMRGEAQGFQQIGTLTHSGDGTAPMILPLFGRPMATRRDRWEYYTTTSGEHMLRISLMFEDKDCTEGDVGCREIYNNDTVFIPSYQKEFTVKLYKYKNFEYSPP